MQLTSAFRFGCFVNVLAMLVQALFAGEIISGRSSGLTLHLATAKILVLWSVLQLLLTISMKLKNLCPQWLVASVAAVLLAEILEFALGETNHLVLHVPLAVAIFGGAIRQLLWTMQMRSRVAMEETR
jgi:hypothetical protein